ncbi:enoyl-CoA hydratase/isomerase family protein [Cupriavidus necator]|uniref:Enoyl-CoA hydratase/isomerase family protein n=1 Tax=Cupriavidus necator TaxID=106590 RepID=A0A367PIP8_CUPNE|nr:enoyl-CoA hydratase/isomerase family protein [Cupriavidus necator]QQX82808.1 enoyl-CoA hydratase/isomerase family protein [Cupriavidus necator]RCJ07454.1 enoyl-CoA hydratase/isomerase family protein [Cupriavidus necator]
MQSRQIPLRHAMLAISDGIAEFTHQRPDVRNALSLALRQDYADMLEAVETDRSIRALILTGSGGSFCAGGDLKSVQSLFDDPSAAASAPDAMRRRMQDIHAWLRRLRDLEIPVIAAVDGPAAGAGFSLALAADFVLASERASFSMAFVRVGLLPDMGALYALPRAVGLTLAKELMFTGRRMDVKEARDRGIVHEIHPAEALADAARRFAARFREAPREGLALAKRALNGSFETSYETMLALEAQGQALASSAPYYREAVGTFLRGEPPRFDWDRAARQA